jgi:glutamate formiminotransferase / 5-formyltetrahydrofolate cyclo-ligase
MTPALAGCLECVVNISEGRDRAAVATISRAAGPCLLDVHSDEGHHRSVLTMAGPTDAVEEAVRSVGQATVAALDLRTHAGAHPRFGVLDVVPWVWLEGWPLRNGPIEPARLARDRFARWAGSTLDLPCFLYGPERSLPDVRRRAWVTLPPDTGPLTPHPTAGAVAVGARPVLVAYNVWLAEPDMAHARQIAEAMRRPGLRTLALQVGASAQVSCNLTDPWKIGPELAFDAVASRAATARAELVGLIPRAVLELAPRHRWVELGLDASSTIEARLEQAGLDGGRIRAGGRPD